MPKTNTFKLYEKFSWFPGCEDLGIQPFYKEGEGCMFNGCPQGRLQSSPKEEGYWQEDTLLKSPSRKLYLYLSMPLSPSEAKLPVPGSEGNSSLFQAFLSTHA